MRAQERTLMVTGTNSVTPHTSLAGKFFSVDEHSGVVIFVRYFFIYSSQLESEKTAGGGGNGEARRGLMCGRAGMAGWPKSAGRMGRIQEIEVAVLEWKV